MLAQRASEVLERRILVLNRAWSPIETIPARKAIGLVAGGAARIVDPVTYEVHDLVSWDAASRAQASMEEERIRSARLALRPPEIIVLVAYGGTGPRRVVFSRGNLYRRDRFACQYCGARPGSQLLSIDHVVPRSRGGASSWENCVVACLRCNARKRNRTPEEAGMALRSRPRRPSWREAIVGCVRSRRVSWERFLSQAYWEVELEP